MRQVLLQPSEAFSKMQTWAELQQRSAVRNSLCGEGGVYISLSVFFHYLFVRILPCKEKQKSWKLIENLKGLADPYLSLISKPSAFLASQDTLEAMSVTVSLN